MRLRRTELLDGEASSRWEANPTDREILFTASSPAPKVRGKLVEPTPSKKKASTSMPCCQEFPPVPAR